MKKFILILLVSFIIFDFSSLLAQDNMGLGTNTPNQHALLEMVANDKGLLITRLSTANRTSLSPVLGTGEDGLLVYDTNDKLFYFWDGTQWVPVGTGSSGPDGDWTVNGNDMYNNNSGNVGVGTTTPTFKLEVNGLFKSFGTTEISDKRYKKDIKKIEDAMAKVGQLQGVYYNWKKEEFSDKNFQKGLQMGLIAQDVENVIPEVVNTDYDGFKSVNYSNLVALLIEGMKEQQQEIERLRSQMNGIDEMKSELNTLKNMITGIEDKAGK